MKASLSKGRKVLKRLKNMLHALTFCKFIHWTSYFFIAEKRTNGICRTIRSHECCQQARKQKKPNIKKTVSPRVLSKSYCCQKNVMPHHTMRIVEKKKNNYRFWHQLKVPFTVWFHKKRKNKNGQKNSILPINKQCKKVIAHKWGFKKPWKKQNKSWFKTIV